MRSPRSAFLLLLLPAIASSAAIDPKAQDGVLAAKAPVVGAVKDYTAITTSNSRAPTQKPAVGTKDAPVDGLDGKPHAGPFVDITSDDKKKPVAGGEDLVKPIPTSLSSKLKEGGYGSSTELEAIPEKNDGVMDDINRVTPKKGTTGTEGGVTERNKKEKAAQGQTGEKVEKKPETPKEAPPLPHSEEERIKDSPEKVKGGTITLTGKPKGAQGLEKPTDLPEKPHDAPASGNKKLTEPDVKEMDSLAPHVPVDAGSSGSFGQSSGSTVKETLPYTEGKHTSPALGDETEGIIQPFHSFVLSFTMIIFSEIGDKTFLVAALMAMRHPQLVVFSGAFSALIAMTVLSAVLGHAVPTLLPKHLTAWLAAGLFLIFGAKLLREGLEMPKDAGVGEEMKEVEAELEEKEHLARKEGRRRSSVSPYVLEAGRGRRSGSRNHNNLPTRAQSPSSSDSSRSPSPSGRGAKASVSNALGGLSNLLSLLLSPAWVQTFVMTFLGEWGDRSQIATIAMAAGQDYWWVTGGAITGHMICTGIAVIGGRALAGKVSLRVVTLGGAIAFLVFGVIYFFEALYD